MNSQNELEKKFKSKSPLIDFKSIQEISKSDAKKEINALKNAIKYHDELYYKQNTPKISDEAYDKLFERLKNLEKKYSEFKSEESPTTKIGEKPRNTFNKIKHTKPLLSIQSTSQEKNIKDFINQFKPSANKKTNYVLEPKFDGFSIEIIYENGEFKHALTRGDGYVGEDISQNVKTIKSIPSKIFKMPQYLSVRGEVFLTKKDFQKINKIRIEKNEKEFSNPRNAAAGLMRQLDSNKVKQIPFKAVIYEIIYVAEQEFKKHDEALQFLKKLNFNLSKKNKVVNSFDEIKKYYDGLKEERDVLDYEIDGVVIKVNELKLREKLGSRARTPRWVIAWKFPPKKEITVLEDIVVQIGRTGILTPVALLRPVNVGGVTISKATLHNEEYVQKKGLSKGDKVKVLRAGDVIPRVEERITKNKNNAKKYELPKRCPVCNSKIVQEGAYKLCPNGLSCDAQIKGRIQHFSSRNAMNIETLGKKTINQLVDKQLVTNISDLYALDKKDILSLEGYNEKSANKLYLEIQNSKQPELSKFIYALGIRLVGRRIAKIISYNFKTLDKLINGTKSDFSKIPEIGPEIEESMLHFFQNKENKKIIKKLKDYGLVIKPPVMTQSQNLKNKTFVLTGTLKKYTREKAKEEIEKRGGKPTESISNNTDYLVVGTNSGSKLDDAKTKNIKILNESEFERLLRK
ncbi:MAG: NAD-dependent DNA ligase LigA [Minisyncoccales bacterium]